MPLLWGEKLSPDCTFMYCLSIYLLLVSHVMCMLLKLHYAKFDVSRLFCSKVIEKKPLEVGSTSILLGKEKVNHLKIKKWIESSIGKSTVLQELDKRPTLSNLNQTQNRRRYINFENGSHFICSLILIILS